MSHTPGEKAVLAQLRHLWSTTAVREQQVKVLVTQWPPTHVETYSKAFQALVTGGFIDHTGGQTFTITDAGLLAIGAEIPKPQPKPSSTPKTAPVVVAQEPPKKRSGFLSRLFGR